ncbi:MULTISPECIES: sugar phosphate isomerase/epimerase family protein [Bradyrhizobium]|uniref:Sugar phosphate isomerase/epimerase n=1 Tax=Bradyrhizobium vignae TaxID=1549949 RepID=A0ABS3ZWD8_9BRAD|nr:sugar phosphate isomerase/epimerase family protein [Bradyrhizobium vignae]MBP0112080.1 sugar phosphate isomerase/epimerase [Bradyrhizobium vignae]
MTLPVLGAHTFGFTWDCIAEEAIERLAAAGYRAIQLMATPPHFDPWREDAARMRRIRALIERHDLSLLALDLASSDINLASPSRDVVDFAVSSYAAAIDRAAELGARWICVGSGRRHALLARANDRLMPSFRDAFARIHDKAERAGVPIILENHPQGLLASAADISAFLDAGGYASMPVIYDVANAFAIGEDPVDGLEVLWPRLGIVHLSDAPKGHWRHDPLGSGAIDFAAIAGLLTRRGYAGQIVLEILSDRPLHDLDEGAAALKRHGLAFSLAG